MRFARMGLVALAVLGACASSETPEEVEGRGVVGAPDGMDDGPAAEDEPRGDDASPSAAGGPAAGGAGSGSQPPPSGGGSEGPTAGEPRPYAMDECDLDTGWAGDEFCILPPPPDQGFQLRVGPSDYDNPDPNYVLEPGEEITNNLSSVSSNEEDIYFLFRQFRIRPGTHHMIVTAGGTAGSGTDSGFGGRRIATSNSSADSPVGGVIAPENEGVGIPLAPRTTLNVSLHSINVTDQPIVREIWVNFWYRDPEQVTETAQQLFAVGDASFIVQPGEDTILGPYTCDIQNQGRMLWFYGHRHANNRRFSAWRVRGGERLLFYDGLHWEEPMLLEYTSLVQNPAPDRAAGVEGGHSGILDLLPGDQLEWECHVVNENPTPLRFTNNTYTGEMCIMDAELVGTACVGGSGFGQP